MRRGSNNANRSNNNSVYKKKKKRGGGGEREREKQMARSFRMSLYGKSHILVFSDCRFKVE